MKDPDYRILEFQKSFYLFSVSEVLTEGMKHLPETSGESPM